MRIEKPLIWVGGAKKEYLALPVAIQKEFGFALSEAQMGRKVSYSKPMKGFGDAAIIELVSNAKGEAYRAVYTVRFENAVYVLAALHKKSKSGIALPALDIKRISERLKMAQSMHQSGM